ncbi:MAG TPA: hypothetical protein VK475_04970, partial [Pyrinomonadaceae bacterium]|nr:hypothetical protein [Pyrinomonadaceae bacterium]
PDCYWTCSLSDPPDGGGGGGGGADPNPNPVMTRRECVNYYWVHFTSYDGGQTWNYADNETYAGCFYMD